jgi:WD repeat-containing protein 35
VNVEADLLELGAAKTNAAATQIEHFGIDFRENGVISYGLVVNGIADRVKNNISLDLLARLLCDAHQDTNLLVANLFSVRQRVMLHCAFKGEPDNRDKYVCVMAERATPKLDAWSYMDGEEMENELKQIIGPTYFAHDLAEGGEVLIFGSRGVIVFGPRCERHHKLLAAHSELQARSMFLRNAFGQCLALTDQLAITKRLAQNHEKDPTNLEKIRERLAEHTSMATILYEIQAFVAESLEVFDASRERLVDDSDDASQTLYDVLHLEDSWRRLQRGAVDMEKVIAACWRSLETLEDANRKITASKKLRMQETIERTTKNLEDAFRAQTRNSTTLEVTQVILSGTLAFDIVDRFSGQYLSFTPIRWATDAVQPYLVDIPGVWFLLNVSAWATLGIVVVFLMRYFRIKHCTLETKKITLDVPVDVAAWRRFIASRDVVAATYGVERGHRVVKYAWTEPRDDVKWLGQPPRFEISVDERYGFALQASVAVNKFTSRIAVDDAWRRFWSDVFLARRIYDQDRETVDPETGETSYVPLDVRDEYDDDEYDDDGGQLSATRVRSILRPLHENNTKRSFRTKSLQRAPAASRDDDDDDDARAGALFTDSDDDEDARDVHDFTYEDFIASKSTKVDDGRDDVPAASSAAKKVKSLRAYISR